MFKLLNWDSTFFGFPVAEITEYQCSMQKLTTILTTLKAQQVRVAYWMVDGCDLQSLSTATKLGLREIEEKVYFEQSLYSSGDEIPRDCEIATMASQIPELQKLAHISGEYSRFRRDPLFSSQYEALYSTWLDNSLNGTIADAVLLVRDQGSIAGIVTVKCRGNRGDIGLIATLPEFRGKGVGGSLLKAATLFFRNHNCSTATVITQAINEGACLFYKKYGFQEIKREKVFHIWLDEIHPGKKSG